MKEKNIKTFKTKRNVKRKSRSMGVYGLILLTANLNFECFK